ncbi:MAG: zinc ribbon domain-containing protein [Halobacteria archaeon]|nr:zinc ribbon domain-containing protein [Halobacteria archaeon]
MITRRVRTETADDEAKSTNLCPECGSRVEKDWLACSQCGEKVRAVCGECDSLVEQEWEYCPYCATSIT